MNKQALASKRFWFSLASTGLSTTIAGLQAADGVPAWVIAVLAGAAAMASMGVALLQAQAAGK